LSLLVDLFAESGPHSEQILLDEPADLAWVPHPHAA
jgi:hypothetical protein